MEGFPDGPSGPVGLRGAYTISDENKEKTEFNLGKSVL